MLLLIKEYNKNAVKAIKYVSIFKCFVRNSTENIIMKKSNEKLK